MSQERGEPKVKERGRHQKHYAKENEPTATKAPVSLSIQPEKKID